MDQNPSFPIVFYCTETPSGSKNWNFGDGSSLATCGSGVNNIKKYPTKMPNAKFLV